MICFRCPKERWTRRNKRLQWEGGKCYYFTGWFRDNSRTKQGHRGVTVRESVKVTCKPFGTWGAYIYAFPPPPIQRRTRTPVPLPVSLTVVPTAHPAPPLTAPPAKRSGRPPVSSLARRPAHFISRLRFNDARRNRLPCRFCLEPSRRARWAGRSRDGAGRRSAPVARIPPPARLFEVR
jgi:hypothetical protein